jgi:hypothetical protein
LINDIFSNIPSESLFSLRKNISGFFFFLTILTYLENNIIRVKLAQILKYSNTPYYLEHPHQCLVCDPAKIFLTSKFIYLLFCNPTHKTEIANRWELLRANHLDNHYGWPIKNREQEQSDHIYYTLL